MKFPSHEFDIAVGDICHGTETDKDLTEFHSLLQSDASARDEYLWRVELHSRLASTVDVEHTSVNPANPSPRRTQPVWAAAVLLVILCLVISYVVVTSNGDSDRNVITQEDGDGAAEPRDGSARQSGSSGALMGIIRQNVRFAYASGAPVIVGTGRQDPIHLGASVPYVEYGYRLHVWNWNQSLDSRVYEFGLHEEERFAVSPDGQWLIWSKGDVINLETGERTTIDLGGANHHTMGQDELMRRIHDMQFTPDGGRIAMLISELDVDPSTHPLRDRELRQSQIIQIVEFPSANLLCEFPASNWSWAGLRVAFSSDGSRVVSEMMDRDPPRISERDVATGEILRVYELDDYAYGIGMSPNGDWIAVCDSAADLLVWSTESGELVHRVEDLRITPGSTVVRFSPDSRYVAFEGQRNIQEVIHVVDVQSGELVASLPEWSVADLHWSPDGEMLTSVSGHMHGEGDGLAPLNNIYPAVHEWDWRAETRIQSQTTSD